MEVSLRYFASLWHRIQGSCEDAGGGTRLICRFPYRYSQLLSLHYLFCGARCFHAVRSVLFNWTPCFRRGIRRMRRPAFTTVKRFVKAPTTPSPSLSKLPVIEGNLKVFRTILRYFKCGREGDGSPRWENLTSKLSGKWVAVIGISNVRSELLYGYKDITWLGENRTPRRINGNRSCEVAFRFLNGVLCTACSSFATVASRRLSPFPNEGGTIGH